MDKFELQIDMVRCVTAYIVPESGGITLAVEDPDSVAIVEMSARDLDDLIDGLVALRGVKA